MARRKKIFGLPLILIRRDGIVIVHKRMPQVGSELGFEKCWAADKGCFMSRI